MIDDVGGEDGDTIVVRVLLGLGHNLHIEGEDGCVFLGHMLTLEGFHGLEDVLFVHGSDVD